MPKIVVLGSAAGPEKSVDVDGPGEFVDVADEGRLPIPFSCRSASCATCHVEVLEGAELLEPPGEDEAELLDIVGGPTGARLACQLNFSAGAGTITLRPVE